MDKDFDKWNKLKKNIEKSKKTILFKEGDIWWSNFGLNIKTESCGKGKNFKRPFLVFRKLSSETCIVIPLSTKIKKGTWFAGYKIHGKHYTALLYQIKMLHINRFVNREGEIDINDFNRIKKKLKKLLNF